MRYFASNTIQYPTNKNIRNDACSFSVSVNGDLPFMSANLTNKKEIINEKNTNNFTKRSK